MASLARLYPASLNWLSQRLQRRVAVPASNPYLEGDFAPVCEERTETKLRVTGRIPEELRGIFTRIGPNPVRPPNAGAYHWFAGDGMVHGVCLEDGNARWYRNRWVGTDDAHRALGRPLLGGPRYGVFDTVNTNVVAHGGRIWALNEGGSIPAELDAGLDTAGRSLFGSDRARAYSAHPHLDPKTGELHAICYEGGPHRFADHVVVSTGGEVRHAARIRLKHAPMIHDCAITDRYVLVLDLPVSFSLLAFFRGASVPYRWDERHEARVGLLPRDGRAGEVVWCGVDPCFVYHVANAYEDADGRVVLHAVVHDKAFDQRPAGSPDHRFTLEEWTLDPRAGRVSRRVIADEPQEFPRIDETLALRRHRYVYTVGFSIGGDAGQPLYRYDLRSGRRERHDFGAHRVPGEAVFVKRSPDAAEGDGWLLTFVHDNATQASDLVIVNAGDMSAKPAAIVHLPVRVPAGFHSTWIPTDAERAPGGDR